MTLSEGSRKKYGYGPKPEDYEKAEGVFVFCPKKVLAWKQFPKDAVIVVVENASSDGSAELVTSSVIAFVHGDLPIDDTVSPVTLP